MDSDAGPEMTLYLRSTQSCMRTRHRAPSKQSEGVEVAFNDLDLKTREGKGVPRRLDMTWETDLRADRGGIDEAEFGKWVEGRRKAMGWSEQRSRDF
jgi:hypothetical protein